jgi:methylated-DNA-[protein]-cysteine S-methyltransferase
MNTYFQQIKSPVGLLTLIADQTSLLAVQWEVQSLKRPPTALEAQDHPVLIEAEKQLSEYFAGTRKDFDLPLKLTGTPFQNNVWRQLQKIPFGVTQTYGELAKKIGNTNASRAVGAANGKNPLSIIVPCHRVIGKTGELTGFAGGLRAKEFLLNWEATGRTLK